MNQKLWRFYILAFIYWEIYVDFIQKTSISHTHSKLKKTTARNKEEISNKLID